MRSTPALRHQLERQALWHAYDGRCGYQRDVPLPGRPDGPDFEVDHVIPRSVWDDPARLAALKARFGVPDGLRRDDYENLVPTTRLFNLAKLERTTGPVWETVIAQGLAEARARAPRVRAELERITHAALAAREPAVTEQERLTAILDLFTKQSPWRPGVREVSDGYWEARRPDAAVFAFVPSAETLQGSALVALRTAGVRGGMATLGHADVLAFLVRGRGQGADPDRRPLLEGRRSNPDEVLVALPNFRTWVHPSVAEQLCEVADAVAELYVGSMRVLEAEVLASTGGAVTADGRLALAVVPESTWHAVRAFADGTGRTFAPGRPWAVDATPVHLVVRGTHPAAGEGNPGGIRAMLEARYARGAPPDKPGEDRPVQLCWTNPGVGGGNDAAFVDAVQSGGLWTAAAVQAWLHEQLLPALRAACRDVEGVERERDATVAPTAAALPPARAGAGRRPWSWGRRDPAQRLGNPAPAGPTPTLRIDPPGVGFPAPWDSICTDASALGRWLADVQSVASMKTPPAEAVLGAQALLAHGLRADWGSRGFREWLLGRFDLPTAADVAAAVDAATAAGTPLPHRHVFDALEYMTRGDAVSDALTGADAEQTAWVAGALRAAYQWWWDERIVRRVWALRSRG